MSKPLLSIEGVSIGFGERTIVDGIDITVERGQTLGIVGESGCGKSLLSLAIMGLVPRPGRVSSGRIDLDGTDLLRLPQAAMRKIRGQGIAMIFQEPMTSLNPVFTVGEQVMEAMRVHGMAGDLRRQAVEALGRVQIADPERRMRAYPHQLSGGMRQRVMIAMAIACKPQVLIADEPTTALDVTVQAQILDVLRDLQMQTGMAIMLITHDLGVVAEMADEVAVMYAGRIAEHAAVRALFRDAQHPYTIGLLGSLPNMAGDGDRLLAIKGMVPSGQARVPGCSFHPRCVFADRACAVTQPALVAMGPAHRAACLRAPLEAAA